MRSALWYVSTYDMTNCSSKSVHKEVVYHGVCSACETYTQLQRVVPGDALYCRMCNKETDIGARVVVTDEKYYAGLR